MKKLLTIQARVLGALILRETRATFGTSKLGYLWAVLTPAGGVAMLVWIFSSAGRQPPFGSSLALFFATGMLTLDFFRKLSNSLMTVLNANRALLAYPPIKELDTIFARFILISATYMVVMLIFYSALIALGLADLPHYPERLLSAFAATALLGFGVGIVNSVILSHWESWQFTEQVLTRPLIILSGVFYIPSRLPQGAVDVLKWNPVLHVVEWFRSGYYPNYDSLVLSHTYVLVLAFAYILIGLAGERLSRKKRA